MEYAPLIERLATELGQPLSAGAAPRLGVYVARVASWNQRVDLTAATEPESLVEVLLADAIVIAAGGLVPERSRILDVGSGSGSPIVPLLLLLPGIQAVALEPRRKRVAFLRSGLSPLGLLQRLEVREQRLEPDSRPGVFELAMSRATFAPGRWLELGVELAPRLIVFGGSEPLPAAPAGWARLREVCYRLPNSGAERRLGLFERASASCQS